MKVASKAILDVEALNMHFPVRKSSRKEKASVVRAVDDLSFQVFEGETLGIVGESGCGKTTMGRCINRILHPTSGTINYRLENGETVDLAKLTEKQLKPYRADIRMIFQDPFSSLNPRKNVLDIVGECLSVNGIAKGDERTKLVAGLLEKVGLRPEYMRRYPHSFSGGERQRIGIARAIALNPRIIVADEAVSALDVSVQAQTLNLLNELKAELNLTYIFISHDLSVVEYICDRIAVMYVGKIIELASRDDLYSNPLHPYTESLIAAAPVPDPSLRGKRGKIRLKGQVADPANPPSGCYFHPRCQYVKDRCKSEEPKLNDAGNGHQVACHFAKELSLRNAFGEKNNSTESEK